jgi:hypothetical protein
LFAVARNAGEVQSEPFVEERFPAMVSLAAEGMPWDIRALPPEGPCQPGCGQDERMLIRMLDAWPAGMLRLARAHVSTEASADDAAQDTLLAVINGWAGLRTAPLKTWICRAPGEKGQAPRTAQRAVITLRDVEGFDTKEACSVLDVSPGRQRVLLHRARAAVRAPVEDYFAAASFGGLGPVR